MASAINWAELLDKKYPSYTVEVNAFLDTANVCKGTDLSIQNIYEAIRNDDNVDSNLKILYHECIYGKNKDVKLRIRNRVAHFRRTLRLHPKIKSIDMLHAPDYANMKLGQMEKKLTESKQKDAALSKAIEEESKRKHKKSPAKCNLANDESVCEETDDRDDGKKAKMEDHDSADTHAEEDSAFDFFANKDATKNKHAEKPDKEIIDLQDEFESKGCNPTLKLEPGDFVFNDEDLDEAVQKSVADLRKYEKESFLGRKKLIPKKQDSKKNKLPVKSKTPAEEKFDLMIEESKSKQKSEEDEEFMRELKKATECVSKNSVEQTAYFWALGQYNNLDMDKFRSEVQQELDGKKNIQKDASHGDTTEFQGPQTGTDAKAEGKQIPDIKTSSAPSSSSAGKIDVVSFQMQEFLADDAETSTYSESDESLIPDDTPLYQNQEADPEVQRLMFKEFIE